MDTSAEHNMIARNLQSSEPKICPADLLLERACGYGELACVTPLQTDKARLSMNVGALQNDRV